MMQGLLSVALLTAVAELVARSWRDAQGQPHLPAVIVAMLLGALLGNLLNVAV